LRDRLHRPREAVSAWNRYRSRFPRGLLRAEADLSVIETLASMDERVAALAEAEAFLARHPASERRAEVERLAGRLRGAVGQ
jgi:outer membrane protein assembly factor BamD (BamD/ComL family)